MHPERDRKSTRLNSSHLGISYAVFCLKKKEIPIEHLVEIAFELVAAQSQRFSFSPLRCRKRLFFFNDTATTEIYTLSLHDALPICLDVDFQHEVFFTLVGADVD